MPEKKDVEINSRADTLDMMHPDIRPYPVTPPPPPEEVHKVYARRKAEEFGKWCEDSFMFKYIFPKDEALRGLKVLDIGLWRMGHKFASSTLAESGAEVICIEPPAGDPARQLTPFGREEYMLADEETGEKCGLEFINEMRNQYAITLNIETEEGRELFKNLAGNADVVIESMPPGYMDQLGVGYRQLSKLNKSLVYCWIGVVGQWGPWKDRLSKFGQWELCPFSECANSWVHNTGFPQD